MKLETRDGQFWIIDDVGLQPLGDRCNVEVLSYKADVVRCAEGPDRPIVRYTVKVADRTLEFVRSCGWAMRNRGFNAGHWSLQCRIVASTRSHRFNEVTPTPVATRRAWRPETTPCPECNGTRRYVGLFETTPCHACCG